MAPGDVFLINAANLSEALPDRWWTPSDAMLDDIHPHQTLVKVLAVEESPEGDADLASAASIWFAVEERDATVITGTIHDSRIVRDGYREGDRISASTDRVFDFVHLDDDNQPVFNEDRARFAVGKQVLVGLTVRTSDGALVERRQFAGKVSSVHGTNGIELSLDGDRRLVASRRTSLGGGSAGRVQAPDNRADRHRSRLPLPMDDNSSKRLSPSHRRLSPMNSWAAKRSRRSSRCASVEPEPHIAL